MSCFFLKKIRYLWRREKNVTLTKTLIGCPLSLTYGFLRGRETKYHQKPNQKERLWWLVIGGWDQFLSETSSGFETQKPINLMQLLGSKKRMYLFWRTPVSMQSFWTASSWFSVLLAFGSFLSTCVHICQ